MLPGKFNRNSSPWRLSQRRPSAFVNFIIIVVSLFTQPYTEMHPASPPPNPQWVPPTSDTSAAQGGILHLADAHPSRPSEMFPFPLISLSISVCVSHRRPSVAPPRSCRWTTLSALKGFGPHSHVYMVIVLGCILYPGKRGKRAIKGPKEKYHDKVTMLAARCFAWNLMMNPQLEKYKKS